MFKKGKKYWRPGVNFINILYGCLFHTKVFCAAFRQLHFGFVVFWRKYIGAKAARKMFMKLTSAFWYLRNILRTQPPRKTRASFKNFQKRNLQTVAHICMSRPLFLDSMHCGKTSNLSIVLTSHLCMRFFTLQCILEVITLVHEINKNHKTKT